VFRQGRFEEATDLAARTLALAPMDDTDAQMRGRVVEGKLLVRDGHHDRGEALVREAVDLAERTEDIHSTANRWMDLAEIIRPTDVRGALAAAETALALFERKGDVVSGARAAALLRALS
jgi:hypothetical protein